jgi:hypothetical protein
MSISRGKPPKGGAESAARDVAATDRKYAMNRKSFLFKFVRARLPVALLASTLQGTPAARFAETLSDLVLESAVPSAVRAAAVWIAALGAIDSVAGASTSGSGQSATATLVADIQVPATDVQGQPFKMDVTVTGPAVTFAKSWDVTNTLPPGINVQGATLVGNLWIVADATSTNGILTISGTPTLTGLYKITFEAWQNTNRSGSVTSGTTTINITAPAGTYPTISVQPQSKTVNAGSSATLSVVASANQALKYQWYKNDLPVVGATNASLAFASVQAGDSGVYSVIVASPGGSVQSQAATLMVNNVASVPVFSLEPVSQTIPSGSTVVFSSLAAGAPLPSYQWAFNGVPIPGATGPTLLISGASSNSAGSYTCISSNSTGSTTSAVATLAVSSTPDIGRLVNISCRAEVGTGGNILIAGFVVGGGGTSGSESVLARASGPALVPFGVAGTLADPQLQLDSGSTVLGTNDGWAGDSSVSAAAASLGAFSWSNPASHDAALLQLLPEGAYTVSVSGQSGDTGVALAEIYDNPPAGTYAPGTPRIINISARVQVGTGSNVLIAGFVIGGSTSRTVLIRASGPALIPFGVTGTLPDPMLQLSSGSGIIATNAAWGGNQQISSVAAAVGAFAWGFSSSNDSAILVTLAPGAYTAAVSGANGDSGIALIEVYEVQ